VRIDARRRRAASWALTALRATPGYRFQRIDDPKAGSTTSVTTIAENGDMVGLYTDAAGRNHGFVRSAAGGTFSDVDYPGARDTYVAGLNVHGAISGTHADAAGAQYGFVRDAHGFRTIDVPGAVSTSPATSEIGAGLGTAVAPIGDDGALVGAQGHRGRRVAWLPPESRPPPHRSRRARSVHRGRPDLEDRGRDRRDPRQRAR
jgi:hypothetical protein